MPFAAWCESAPRRAARRAFRFTFTSKLRIPGAKATPPPVNCGARIVPARARPVPFWRHGFARPPATRPRLFAPRVPRRAALSSARTVSWTRWGLTSASKTNASSATSFALPPSTAALTAISVLPPGSRRGHSSVPAPRRGRGSGCAPRPLRGRRGPTCVTRLPPIRPAIFLPLNTRDGVADAPIEPGLRTLCEPWLFGPLAKLWRLIVPWNPLPIDVPDTLIRSPGSKAPTVTLSPTWSSVGPRNSARWRCPPTPALRRWPSSPFVTRRSATGWKASWTAS